MLLNFLLIFWQEVENEYNETKKRYDFLTEQTNDLEKAIDSLEEIITELDKIIKKRFDEVIIQQLLQIAWWNWEDEKIQKYMPLLLNNDISKFISEAEKKDE